VSLVCQFLVQRSRTKVIGRQQLENVAHPANTRRPGSSGTSGGFAANCNLSLIKLRPSLLSPLKALTINTGTQYTINLYSVEACKVFNALDGRISCRQRRLRRPEEAVSADDVSDDRIVDVRERGCVIGQRNVIDDDSHVMIT